MEEKDLTEATINQVLDKAETKTLKPKPKWIPICQVSAEDFDEGAGKYLGAQTKVELQQERHSKVIRIVKVG